MGNKEFNALTFLTGKGNYYFSLLFIKKKISPSSTGVKYSQNVAGKIFISELGGALQCILRRLRHFNTWKVFFNTPKLGTRWCKTRYFTRVYKSGLQIEVILKSILKEVYDIKKFGKHLCLSERKTHLNSYIFSNFNTRVMS